MIRNVAILLMGILLGSSLMYYLQGKKIDDYYWEKESLKVELYEATERLKKIQEQHEKLLPAQVKEVSIKIINEEEVFIEPSLRKTIYDLAKELIGQELLALPYPLAYNLLHNRIVENGKKKYQLQVEAIILAETVVFYLRVKKLAEDVVAMIRAAHTNCA